MIYKFQPFSTDKQFGNEVNKHCALVPNDDDWILLLDYDAMVLHTSAYELMEKAIVENPHIEIFGANTNRVGHAFHRTGEHQVGPDPDADIRQHIRIAQTLAERFSNGEVEEIPTCAGFFMLFRKSYWQANKFIPTIVGEHGKYFDYHFCYAASKRRTIAKILGVYVWHTYRLQYGEDWTNDKHLR